MMLKEEDVFRDLSLFADLDSNPSIAKSGDDWELRFAQGGYNVRLTISRAGKRVLEDREEQEQVRHSTYLGLLKSPGFGNLQRFVRAQQALLFRDAPTIADHDAHLPIIGRVGSSPDTPSQRVLVDIDNWLCAGTGASTGTRVLVIDGPAGIGKTFAIRRLAFDRAVSFGPGSRPPLLHIQSRGKKLTTLPDLIEGTIGAMRHTLTSQQVNVLVRHGLLQIAIDGFDELADPSGYDTAWNSLRSFIEDLDQRGAVVLAGRDTFIDAERVQKAIPSLSKATTVAAHLEHLSPLDAERWLTSRGHTENQIAALKNAGLLEPGSYALRPFFISQVSLRLNSGTDVRTFYSFPLRALVSDVVSREAAILADLTGESGGEPMFTQLLNQFFEEVARDMADSEGESLDDGSLTLIAELVFADKLTADNVGMMKNRIATTALLENDIEPDRRRFPHSEIQDYFLGRAYLRLVGEQSLPKSIRRNVLGSDFLETFADLCVSSPVVAVDAFVDGASGLLADTYFDDRSRRNIAALVLAASAGGSGAAPRVLSEVPIIEEAVVRGTVLPTQIKGSHISQLDVRGADIRDLVFTATEIDNLIGDDLTVLPNDFPAPFSVSDPRTGAAVRIFDRDRIQQWLYDHKIINTDGFAPSGEHFALLQKLCRITLRQNWIRALDDDMAGRHLADARWPALRNVLERHQLLSVRENVGVGGPASDFVRINRASDILARSQDHVVRAVLTEVTALG